MKNPGCLRKVLIGIILLMSISSALVYFTFVKGMYKAEEVEYTAIVIENGLLFSGLDEIPNQQRILIRKGSISCIGSACEVPENAKIIDASGLSVLPALTDLGIQFYRASGEDRNSSSFQQFISFTQQRPEVRQNFHLAGISTIRSIGDAPQNILVLKEQVESGKLAGPRIYTSGLMITAPEAYPQINAYKDNAFMQENGVMIIDGPNSIAESLETLTDLEVDGIKIVYKSFGGQLPIITFEEMESIISKGKEKNLWISVLTGSNQELSDALNAGAEVIESGTSEAIDSTTLKLLVEKRALYLPMLSSLEADTAALKVQLENVQRMYKAGARIGAASDNQPYQRFGKSLQRELELLAKSGLTPDEVIRAASIEAAISLKTDDRFGSLEEGKWADILITAGKPWENIGDIKAVKYLIQEGKVVVEEGKVLD